jgi:hypothetical protein
MVDEAKIQISVSVPKEDVEDTANELQAAGGDPLIAPDAGFDGAHAIDILTILTPTVAATVAAMYAKRQAAKRYVSVKFKGVEVKGVSEGTLLKIIDRMKPPAAP